MLEPVFADTHPEKVVLQLRWDHQFQFAGYYAALWNGHYEDEGLDVEILPAVSQSGIVSSVKEVSEGRAHFGIGSSDILLANDSDVKLSVVSSIFQTSAARFFALESAAFERVADLVDLRVARRVGDLIDVELQAMVQAEGIDIADIEPFPHQPGIDHLLDGSVDVIPGYSISIPFGAERRGVKLRELQPSAYGVDFYGDSLFARRDLVIRNPEFVARFVRASLRGWQDALSNPEVYVQRIARILPRTSQLPAGQVEAFNRFQAEGVDELTLFGVVQLGHVNPERWRRMHTIMASLGLVQQPLDLEAFVFDPIADEKRRDENLVFFITLAASTIVAVGFMTLIWNTSLRRQVAERTSEIEKSRARRERDKQRLDEIITGTNIGTWELDIQTGVAVINDRWAAMIGYSLEELGTTTIEALRRYTDPRDKDEYQHVFDAHLSGHSEFYEYEARVQHKNGSIIWVRDRGRVVARDRVGAPLRASGTRIEITAEKNKELALIGREQELQSDLNDMQERRLLLEEQANELASIAENQAEMRGQAEAAERSKSEFLASMSHEIRTPMTGVLGFADLLLSETLPDSQREMVEKIRVATTNLLTVINDILDLSKIEAGKLELEELPFNPRTLAQEVIELVGARASEKGLVLSLSVEDEVPETLMGDPTRLRQVLLNLLGNGVKFTHKGSVSLTVSLSSEDSKAPLCFSVRDTGIGIPEDRIDFLFSSFTQADPSITRKYEGTGLGLAISKRLVEMMGGEIGLESELGVGSAFYFNLPMEEAEGASIETSRIVGPARFQSKKSLNILVVEDNDINQTIIGAFIGKAGHSFEIVDNGVKAVESVSSASYDLVLMDVRMPEMSGPEATRVIRAKDGPEKDIPIIALTADAMEQHVIGYREAGMNGYVSKPIDQSELLMTINSVLGEEIHKPIYEDDSEAASDHAPPASGAGLTKDKEEAVSAEIADIFANIRS